MAKAVLLADALAWYDEDGLRHEADGRGTEVDLPSDAYDRHLAAGNVAKPGKAAASDSDETPPSDEVKALMDSGNREELDAQAAAEGVEDPASLANKRAVAEAIVAARG